VSIGLALQQPRPEIFALMDTVILMKSGGALLYNGPPAAVGPFLQAQGYRQDPQVRILA
jgi:hypothetical protein